MKRIAVLGGGHGGKCVAAYLGLKGYTVHLYDRFEEPLLPVQQEGGIQLIGCAGEAFVSPRLVTTDLKAAVSGCDMLLVVLPAFAHAYIAAELAPLLEDGQNILLCPGSTGGCLEFSRQLRSHGCHAAVRLAETNTLFFAARSYGCRADIMGIKETMYLAALPASDTSYFLEALKDPFPMLLPMNNVLEVDLNNLNPIVHPLVLLLNAGRVESGETFKFYHEGYSPRIAEMVVKLDAERLAICRALGLESPTLLETWKKYYGVDGKDLYDTVMHIRAYDHTMSPPDMDCRMLTEDIPMGLVPMCEFAHLAGVPTPLMDSVIEMAGSLLHRDLRQNGRTLSSLGLEGMSLQEMLQFVQA